MIVSKLTAKAQTTIPKAVRAALGLRPGDDIVYVIEADRVVLEKAGTGRPEDPFSSFGEWANEADRRAYADL